VRRRLPRRGGRRRPPHPLGPAGRVDRGMWSGVATICPGLFGEFLQTSLIGRARQSGKLELEVRDLRGFTDDPHRVVDDEPYGGGGGMGMTAAPWARGAREMFAQG